MSVEIGTSAVHVMISPDGFRGKTREALQENYAEVTADLGEDSPLARGMKILLYANSPGETIINDPFQQKRSWLMGNASLDSAKHPYDALVFAETRAEDVMASGAFSVVRVAKWTSRSYVDLSEPQDGKTLADELVDLSLRDVKESGYPMSYIPVERLSVIRAFESDDESYVYGQAREVEAVRSLDVPEPLGALLQAVTNAYHATESRA